LLSQLAQLERAQVKTAMIAPGLVDGRPLSHRDHDRLWAAFVDHGVRSVSLRFIDASGKRGKAVQGPRTRAAPRTARDVQQELTLQ
jgi:hypothetical protein